MTRDARQLAEQDINARIAAREKNTLPFREAFAIELIADEMTRIRAELEMARYDRRTPSVK